MCNHVCLARLNLPDSARAGSEAARILSSRSAGIAGWKRIAALAPEIPPTRDGWYNLMDWALGCLMVYMILFAIGKLILGAAGMGMLFLVIAAFCGGIIYWDLSRRGWETLSGAE